jgi:hypothetical protein
MTRRGYPQLERAHRLKPATRPAAQYHPLSVHPLELGPSTNTEARKFGVLGTGTAFREPESGIVLTNDRAYTSNLNACRRGADDNRLPGHQKLVDRSQELLNQLRRDHFNRIRLRLRTLLSERLSCVGRQGYDVGEIDDWLGRKPHRELLNRAGVEPGAFIIAEKSPPALTERNQILVVPPAPLPKYRVSTEERIFAQHYVACGEAIGFKERLTSLQADATQQLAADDATRSKINRLIQKLMDAR